MIKKINIEEIKKREEFLYGKLLTRKEVEYALEEAKASVKRNMEYLDGKFPFSAAYNSEPFPSERDGMYPITENVEWTTGFWTGLIWLMYDWSREECFKELGMADVRSFKERVDKRIDLNHHDLGFLYSPSCVAAYQLCQSEEGKEAALQAADIHQPSEEPQRQKNTQTPSEIRVQAVFSSLFSHSQALVIRQR